VSGQYVIGTTITPSAPWSSAYLDSRTASAVVRAPVPTITGTRPLTCSTAAVVIRRRSSSVKEPIAPVLPRTATPFTPRSIRYSRCERKRSSSSCSPSFLVGVTGNP
jgi:hypothetical protein